MNQGMKRVANIIIRVSRSMSFGVFVTVLVALTIFLLWSISGRRIVGRAVAPDGTEMCIVQQFGLETQTSFVFRKPGRPWNWFYYDHQDDYWAKSRVELNTNSGVAVFYRENSAAVTFDWWNEIYTLHRIGRVVTNSQPQIPQWVPKSRAYFK